MEANEFVRKWAASIRTEEAAKQEHFIDLCRLVGEKTPNEADPRGDFFAFEKGARGREGDGFADVWSKGHFAWEYKGKRKDLIKAYEQVQRYREALDNPPLLVVCDFDRYEVHTNFTGTETWVYYFTNEGISTDARVDVRTIGGTRAKDAPDLTAMVVLKALFEEPDRLKPQRTREQITEDAAKLFGEIADGLRAWEIEDMRIARFITKVMFCMFATDVGLLPKGSFSEVIRAHKESGDAAAFRRHLSVLFRKMNKGGDFGAHRIPEFDGLMFRDTDVPEKISGEHIHILARLDELDWASVEPAVFGTLFEGILQEDKKLRKALGAHYTSRADIELIVEPVLMRPLRAEWQRIVGEVEAYAEKRVSADAKKERARKLILPFHRRLTTIRVLDPACGSGNFLYVSMALLKALEKEVVAYASSFEITITPRVHPSQLLGIEINDYAHELASIVVWIGYLQWKKENQPAAPPDVPILEPLERIEQKDAIVASKGGRPIEAAWPEADVIVGNPPFLGGKMLRKQLGDAYVDRMFAVYDGRVARESDLCCYWFEKARAAIETGKARRAELLATQAIRGGANRKVLERVKETGDIFYAQSDRPWVLDGAAVRVSMVGFDDGMQAERLLNWEKEGTAENALKRARLVQRINANLTASEADVTQARRLKESVRVSFMGDTKVGPFDIPEKLARQMLAAPNPHGKPNADVVRPWVNGLDITRRPRNMWIIDFPPGMSEKDAAKYEAPFEYIKRNVMPMRQGATSVDRDSFPWWGHGRHRQDMRNALGGLARYVGTPRVTKYRFFVWLETEILADAQLIVFARSDDYFFGVLHSRAHEVWARATGTQLREAESGFRYTPTSCFETFPFPRATQQQQWTISLAAKDLNALREGWLNPEGMMGAKELAKRTLTNLYNQRPQWLQDAHRTLDEAVFAAYGWREKPPELPDEALVARLLKVNLEREPA
ncbi:MAG: DNA methyltransferase [Dehalococcoidia bacterium]